MAKFSQLLNICGAHQLTELPTHYLQIGPYIIRRMGDLNFTGILLMG
jgi:hypothetical protein